MPNPSDTRQQILARYSTGPALLEAAIRGLDAADLDLSLSPDSWSIRQLIHHIADGDYLWKEFLLRAAGDPEHEFSLEWYWCLPQDEWVKRWSYAGRDLAPSFALLKANRRHTQELLEQVPGLWEKSLLISSFRGGQERVSVGEVVEMQARHVEGHVDDIRQVRHFHGV